MQGDSQEDGRTTPYELSKKPQISTTNIRKKAKLNDENGDKSPHIQYVPPQFSHAKIKIVKARNPTLPNEVNILRLLKRLILLGGRREFFYFYS